MTSDRKGTSGGVAALTRTRPKLGQTRTGSDPYLNWTEQDQTRTWSGLYAGLETTKLTPAFINGLLLLFMNRENQNRSLAWKSFECENNYSLCDTNLWILRQTNKIWIIFSGFWQNKNPPDLFSENLLILMWRVSRCWGDRSYCKQIGFKERKILWFDLEGWGLKLEFVVALWCRLPVYIYF